MSKDYMALIDPDGNPALVYMTPTAIPYADADAARLATECLSGVVAGLEQDISALRLLGACDGFDLPSSDHLQQIGMLIVAATAGKFGSGPTYQWNVDEPNLKLV